MQSYIHAGNKIGVLVEVDCQTDFVARNEKFVEFARDLALHIAAAAPVAVSDEDVPAEDREREERIAVEQAADRPENVRERIVKGKLDKWLDDVVLLRQKHVNEDKYGGKTIEELRAELAAETRENIVVRRFSPFRRRWLRPPSARPRRRPRRRSSGACCSSSRARRSWASRSTAPIPSA